MNYKLIHKNPDKQPNWGVYSDWKVQISDECFQQCVYCTIHENHWGGIDHYHIDHFRPKSIPAFKPLENDICNLFYACPVCNRFKSDDWPAEPDLAIPSYPDPSVTDYSTIFNFDLKSFLIVGNNISANYLIVRLYLNRPQLVYERRESILRNRELQLFQEIADLAPRSNDISLITKAFTLFATVKVHLSKRETIRPYKLSEIRKP